MIFKSGNYHFVFAKFSPNLMPYYLQAMDDPNLGFGDELNISGANVKMEPGYSEAAGTSADMTQGQGMVGVKYLAH